MLSFHNDPEVKRKYVERVEAHRNADEIIRGTGWDGFRGCAVGCTLEAYNHSLYPIELGIPEWLARLEDTLFEGMSLDRAMDWPSRFLDAIPLGVTDEQFERNVKATFLVMVLESALKSFDNAKYPDCAKAVNDSIALWKRSDIGSQDWNKAAAEAEARAATAAWAAWADAASWAAARADAASWAAGARASLSACAEAAWWAATAGAEKYDYFADELLKLLNNADGR